MRAAVLISAGPSGMGRRREWARRWHHVETSRRDPERVLPGRPSRPSCWARVAPSRAAVAGAVLGGAVASCPRSPDCRCSARRS